MLKKHCSVICLLLLLANLVLFTDAQKKSIRLLSVSQKVDFVLRLMTFEKQIGQLNQYSDYWTATGLVTADNDKANQIRKGQVGSLLNCLGNRT